MASRDTYDIGNQQRPDSHSGRSDETNEEIKNSHERPWSQPIDYKYVPDLSFIP